MTFARLDGVNRLLGGKVAAFDMRSPDRIYLRVPGRADLTEQSAVAATQSKPSAAKQDSETPAKAAEKPTEKPAAKPAAKKDKD